MEKEEPQAAARPVGSELPRTRVMRLFDITQIAAARVVNTRNVLPLLQFAHLTRAHLLQDICMQVTMNNIDAILLEPFSRTHFQAMVHDCPDVLALIEACYKARLRPPMPSDPKPPQPATSAHSTPGMAVGTYWQDGQQPDVDLSLLASLSSTPPDPAACMLPAASSVTRDRILPPLFEDTFAEGEAEGSGSFSPARAASPVHGRGAVEEAWASATGSWVRGGVDMLHTRRPTAGSLAVAEVAPLGVFGGSALAAEHDARRRQQAIAQVQGSEERENGGSTLSSVQRSRSFKTREDERTEKATSKVVAHVRKRLQQMRRLEATVATGGGLDAQQHAKLAQRDEYLAVQAALENGESAEQVQKTLDRLREELLAATSSRHTAPTGTSSSADGKPPFLVCASSPGDTAAPSRHGADAAANLPGTSDAAPSCSRAGAPEDTEASPCMVAGCSAISAGQLSMPMPTQDTLVTPAAAAYSPLTGLSLAGTTAGVVPADALGAGSACAWSPSAGAAASVPRPPSPGSGSVATVTGFAAPSPALAAHARTSVAAKKLTTIRKGQLSEFLAGHIDRSPSPPAGRLEPPSLTRGNSSTLATGVHTGRATHTPGGTSCAWGGAGAMKTPAPGGTGVSLASLLGEVPSACSSKSAGPQRSASELLKPAAAQTPAAAGPAQKGSRGKGVKITLAQFQAGGKPGGQQPDTVSGGAAVERSSSGAPAWGRPSAPVDTSEHRTTPPSLSAIMSDERTKRCSEAATSKGAAAKVSAGSGRGTGPATLVARKEGGRAWQTQDLTEYRKAVIDEALFERASQLPDIRPTGLEGFWGRAAAPGAAPVAKIHEIQLEEQRLARESVSEMPRRASASCLHSSSEATAATAATAQAAAAYGQWTKGDGIKSGSKKGSGRGAPGKGGRFGEGGGSGRRGSDVRGGAGGGHGGVRATDEATKGSRSHAGEKARHKGGGRGGRGKGGREGIPRRGEGVSDNTHHRESAGDSSGAPGSRCARVQE